MAGPRIPCPPEASQRQPPARVWGRRFRHPLGCVAGRTPPQPQGEVQSAAPAAGRTPLVGTAPSPHLSEHRVGPWPWVVSPNFFQNGNPSTAPSSVVASLRSHPPTEAKPPCRHLESHVHSLQSPSLHLSAHGHQAHPPRVDSVHVLGADRASQPLLHNSLPLMV